MLCPRAPAVRNLWGTCPRQLYGAGAYDYELFVTAHFDDILNTDSNNKYSITDGIRTQAFYTQSKLCTATPRELVQCPRSLKVEIYSNVTAID